MGFFKISRISKIRYIYTYELWVIVLNINIKIIVQARDLLTLKKFHTINMQTSYYNIKRKSMPKDSSNVVNTTVWVYLYILEKFKWVYYKISKPYKV